MGFVDENENIVIEPQFFDAKDFTEKGSCFVKQEISGNCLDCIV